MKTIATAMAALLLLSACAGTSTRPSSPAQPSLFADELFAPATQRLDAAQVFEMSLAMQRFVDTAIAQSIKRKGIERALLDALYSKDQLQLEYDAGTTRTAKEAFELRAGNCLSLVLMTAAIAKHLALPVVYQQVFVPHSWTRSNGIAFASQHVNLVLGKRPPDTRTPYARGDTMTVDFLASEDASLSRTRPIAEATVIAMYFNNRAAEELALGQYDPAYWWARAAIWQDPQFLNAYNTLGVIYLQKGLPLRAEAVLGHVLAMEPGNTLTLSNLASVQRALGRHEAAAKLVAELASIEPTPPFHFADLGRAALETGDYAAAKRYFERELRRDAFSHESLFGLAMAEYRLGNARAAERQLLRAIDSSSTRFDKGIYVAKLDTLRAAQAVVQ